MGDAPMNESYGLFLNESRTEILSESVMHTVTKLIGVHNECQLKYDSALFFDRTRVVNIFATVVVILIGIVGNVLAIIVFAQKRFRLKSPGVFLLCLAISDGLFLLVHFFEDTLRTYIDVYVDREQKVNKHDPNCSLFVNLRNQTNDDSLLKTMNITDNYDLACRLVNYLRYVLRFVSAYIITIFTIQRAVVIFFPLCQSKFSSTSYAWRVVIGLCVFAAALCSFVPFVFSLNSNESKSKFYCDINKSTPFVSRFYFVATIIYIALIMFIPIITIIVCNTLITFQLCRLRKEREILCNMPITKPDRRPSDATQSLLLTATSNVTTDRRNSADILKWTRKNSKIKDDSHKVTRMLVVMSLSFAILNLPYFFAWCIFYYKIAINASITYTSLNNLFGALNIAEIFYVINYGIHFFLYCASGKQFREQLKASFFKNKHARKY
jgi:hypothetical protein